MHNILYVDTTKIIKYLKVFAFYNMFRITEDPSSGSLIQCLAKNDKNDPIVGVMAAYSDPLCVGVVHCI